jgi:hypothetical protein
MSMPAAYAARHAGPASGGITYLPFICANVSSSIMKSLQARGGGQSIASLSLVNANAIAVQ